MRYALAAIVCVLGLAATGCGGEGKKSVATTTVTTTATATSPTGAVSVTTHGRFHYPPALVNSYMRSCTRGDTAKKAYCGCTLDKLSNDVSVQDFVKVGLAGGKLPPRIHRLINRAAKACADKL